MFAPVTSSRRSCLSVPGLSTRMLDKARSLPADEIVIDLEDSVTVEHKEEARATVAAALSEGEWTARSVAVRINQTASRFCHRDVIEVVERAGDALSCLVVPKVEAPDDVRFVDRLLGMVEEETGRDRPIALQALIETAAGLAGVREIVRASDRLEALIVGYADLGASLGRSPAAGEHWSPVLDTVLVAARAAGLQAIDGPHLDIPDIDGMRAAAARARALGYDGKWALHPTQVEPLNEIFSPTGEELERAGAVLDALDRAESGEGRGAAMLDGEMIDEASRKRALGVQARGSAADGP